MSPPVKQCTFAGGEITPAAWARSDLGLYEKSARTLRNMICMKHGGVTGRPGTMYVGTTFNGGNPVRLIPFIFNETGLGQSYTLEFGNQYIAFYQNGGVVVSAPNTPYTIVSPYLQADLANLQFDQCADVITIVNRKYPPMELARMGSTNWSLSPITFAPIIQTPLVSNITGGNTSLTPSCYYTVTAVNGATGEESAAGNYVVLITAAQADTTHPVTLAWAAITNATSYRIYRTVPIVQLGVLPSGWGYIGTVTNPNFSDFGTVPDFTNEPPIISNPFVSNASPVINFQNFAGVRFFTYAWEVTAIVDGSESSPTPLHTANTQPPGVFDYTFSWNAFPGATSYNIYGRIYGGPLLFMKNQTTLSFTDDGTLTPSGQSAPTASQLAYPGTVAFIQQRRAFASSAQNPIGFQMTQSGLFYSFATHALPQDSDAIFGSIAGNEINQIEHLAELKFALMLTAGAELYIQGNGAGVVTPSAINASVQSSFGSSALKPLKAGDILIFNQALGSKIRDFAFDFAIDGYRGNDISIFASHLFEGYQIVDWCYQKEPDSIIWAVRSDGKLLSCTYIREQQVLAWTQHDFTNGFVENVCAIPENGAYAVYLSIRRIINGSTVRYIERLSSRIWQGPTAAVAIGTANALGDPVESSFCDCYAQFDGRNTTTDQMNMFPTDRSAQFDNTDQAYLQNLTLEVQGPFGLTTFKFTPDMVGDQIFYQDALFISSQGKAGNQIRCTIQSYLAPNEVTATPSGIVPAVFRFNPISLWAHAVQTVSGLDYLAGQQVSVWADRFAVGSPLNSHYSTIYTVPSNGILTLDKPYSVIYVGLAIIQDIETLDLETYFGETILGRRKRVSGLTGYIYQTRSFYAGSENPDTNNQNTSGDPLFQLFPLRTGVNQKTYDQPPDLITNQDYLITMARWNKRGSIFMRNVDPVPWTLLAVSPREEDASQTPYKRV